MRNATLLPLIILLASGAAVAAPEPVPALGLTLGSAPLGAPPAPVRRRGRRPAPPPADPCLAKRADPKAARLLAELAALEAELAVHEESLAAKAALARSVTAGIDRDWIEHWTCEYHSTEEMNRDATGCGAKRDAYRAWMDKRQRQEQWYWNDARVEERVVLRLRGDAAKKEAALRQLLGSCAP